MLLPPTLRASLNRLFLRRRFDNRKFWNDRYANDPVKGSGPGSRGEFGAVKNQLIRERLEENDVRSVLDVGCGDISILDGLKIQSYIGIDISEVVIKRNKLLRPNWEFWCEDLTCGFVPPPADLVLCLDVLIHQPTFVSYSTVLSKALGAARHLALVSGYAVRDPGWNVFFYEPIYESIRRLCPDCKVKQVAEYRGTQLLEIRVPKT